MKTRIREVRKSNGLSTSEFAEKVGASDSSVKSWENGRKTPSDIAIKSICGSFGVNYDWLVYGSGEMLGGEPEDEMKALIEALMPNRSEFAKDVILRLSKLDEKYWKVAEELIDEFSNPSE